MNKHWRTYARQHIGHFGIAAWLFGVLLLLVVEWRVRDAEQQVQQAQSMQHNVRQQLQLARQAQAVLQIEEPLFRQLQQRHLLNMPPLQDWSASVGKLQQVAHFSYTLSPPQVGDGPSAQWQAVRVPMQLTLDVPHELPLLAFFAELTQLPHGWFQLEGCVVRRVEAGLQAACYGRWLVLQMRGTT